MDAAHVTDTTDVAGVGNSLNVESVVTHHTGVADAANISWCRPVLWILNCL